MAVRTHPGRIEEFSDDTPDLDVQSPPLLFAIETIFTKVKPVFLLRGYPPRRIRERIATE